MSLILKQNALSKARATIDTAKRSFTYPTLPKLDRGLCAKFPALQTYQNQMDRCWAEIQGVLQRHYHEDDASSQDLNELEQELTDYIDAANAALQAQIVAASLNPPNTYSTDQANDLFIKFVNPPGVTITLSSPNGAYKRILGCNNDGSSQDDIDTGVILAPIPFSGGAVFYTASQVDTLFARFLNVAGSTIILTSPGGLAQRMIGCNNDGTGMDDVPDPTGLTAVPLPGVLSYYTVMQMEAVFCKMINDDGRTVTFTSPNGLYQRIIGCNDDGSAQDDIVII